MFLLLLLATGASRLLAMPPQHPHQHKRATREEIIALEGQWRQAALNLDVASMDKLLSDDYLGITGTGDVLTKAQQIDRMRARQIAITKLEISDVKVKLIGQIAIVNSLANLEGTNDGRPMSGSFRYTRVYRRFPNGAWKITSFEATRISPGHKPGRNQPQPGKPDPQ